jgi:uncharacterized protein YodC (DUF2158 family)
MKAGDIVKLKSGGPDMTIVFIDTDQVARCVWYCTSEFNIKWQDLAVVTLIPA